MNAYEIEIKSLLGEEKNAKKLCEKMCALDPECHKFSANKQLNHYFEPARTTTVGGNGDMSALVEKISAHLTADNLHKLEDIIERGSNFSIRTRQKDDEVLLVVKASVDEGSSANTVSRLEFEEPVSLSLDELDELLISAGFEYQAKWSREREEYAYKGINVCIDKNAGYGFLAEFEKVLEDLPDAVASESALASARAEIAALMAELEVEELQQDRLERMFAHYNQNWPEYYGTDKVFVIE